MNTDQNKIIAPDEIEQRTIEIRSTKKTIATVNGSFDLLHAGHLHILVKGSQAADVFIVALNSDSSISDYKGKDRPIIPLKYRLEMMASLKCVNYVTWFDEKDPCQLLSLIKPDIHVNGVEYGHDCVEAITVQKYGGRLQLVERLPGLSTTQIIEKIKTL